MSTANPKKTGRDALLAKLWDLGRLMSTQTVFLHQAIAQSFGLNATDTKCIDLILRAGDEPITAGWLSDATGLTTGAVTHILDRLEKRRHIERYRDKSDRRKVLIRLLPNSLRPMIPRYEQIGKAYTAMLKQYSDDDLELICDYLEQTSEISHQELQKLIAENRERAASET